jgi:hypothetical protein
LSINIKPVLFIFIGAFLFSFGCATAPPKVITPPKQTQEPSPPPAQIPAPQPAAPTPEKTAPVKELPPSATVTPPAQIHEPRSTVPSPSQAEKSAPRTVASLRLTEQARLLIESKKPDDAISILEKAMNIDTNNGQNYYYLAEAWILKGNKNQAVEFNRMAGLYLNNDESWKAKIKQQKERIDKIKSVR